MKKRANFGVDPSSLELVSDLSFQVPKVLMLMRKSMDKYQAFKEEGIFRYFFFFFNFL
jgi:hypothetical protein